jgi:RNA polymerase sigma factor (sigma-70 family)
MATMTEERTTTALLHGLHDPENARAWTDLDARCRPIMLAVARRIGFGEAEAEDLVQASMASFVEAYRKGQYNRERGRLNTFLITILRSRAIDLWRKKHRRREADTPPEAIEQLSDRHVTRLWMDERQSQLLRRALDELRQNGTDRNMLAAFEMFGVGGIGIAEVTERLGMSREEVYNAKYRITQRLRPIVARLDELYEDL